MKSRRTTWLLLGVVILIWGAIGWKICFPSGEKAIPDQQAMAPSRPVPAERRDTLRCDYPDPFTRGTSVSRSAATRSRVRSLPPKTVPVRREKVQAEHLGTICVEGEKLYILSVKGVQYEMRCGEPADGFVLCGCDGDSLYLKKQGVKYGVKLCD